jgi:hypothetical protein
MKGTKWVGMMAAIFCGIMALLVLLIPLVMSLVLGHSGGAAVDPVVVLTSLGYTMTSLIGGQAFNALSAHEKRMATYEEKIARLESALAQNRVKTMPPVGARPPS